MATSAAAHPHAPPSGATGIGSLRVDLLTPCFWPEVRRGTERFVRELADGLLARGHAPRLVTSHPGKPSRTVEDGLPIVRVPRPPIERRLARRRYEDYLTHTPLSYAVLSSGDAQIAHATAPPDAAMAAKWSARTGRPAIFSYMGVPDHEGLMHRRRRLDITLEAIEGCCATIALSEYARREFDRWLGYDARVIYPGVNLARFPVGRERTDEPTVVCSAALHEQRKRVPLLVEAHHIVRRTHPNARLLLNRPTDESLAQAFADPLSGVELVDMDDQAVLAALNGEAWAAALPSTNEAFGLVLVEALATGTPVVASDLGPFPEIVDRPEVGRLFPGDDAQDLAQALLETFELAGDPATRDACVARARDFSTDRVAVAYEDLYRELLAAS
jgi:glycosyltransferase involved in cell wall biosynthesis